MNIVSVALPAKTTWVFTSNHDHNPHCFYIASSRRRFSSFHGEMVRTVSIKHERTPVLGGLCPLDRHFHHRVDTDACAKCWRLIGTGEDGAMPRQRIRWKLASQDASLSSSVLRRRSSYATGCATCGYVVPTSDRRAFDAGVSPPHFRFRSVGVSGARYQLPPPPGRGPSTVGGVAPAAEVPSLERSVRCRHAPRRRPSGNSSSAGARCCRNYRARHVPPTATTRCCRRGRCPSAATSDFPASARWSPPQPRSAATTCCWWEGFRTCSGTRWSCRHCEGARRMRTLLVVRPSETMCGGWFQTWSALTCPCWTATLSVSRQPANHRALLIAGHKQFVDVLVLVMMMMK